jgi:hypothetical protein
MHSSRKYKHHKEGELRKRKPNIPRRYVVGPALLPQKKQQF